MRKRELIEVWPALSADVKGEILTLAGLHPYDVDHLNDVTREATPHAKIE